MKITTIKEYDNNGNLTTEIIIKEDINNFCLPFREVDWRYYTRIHSIRSRPSTGIDWNYD